MIQFEEARKIVMSYVKELPAENTGLLESLNRVLALDILSDIDMPPFDKSAMDGYACRRVDILSDLDIIEVVAAGRLPEKEIGPGECAKIMTGAKVPAGADCVLMIEQTEITPEGKVRFKNKTTDDNIAYRGQDVRTGETVLKKGTLIKPEHVAILAMAGIHHPDVARRPSVGVITTGSELIEPFHKPAGPQIRNSNGWQLSAQLMAMGCRVSYYGIVEDNTAVIEKTIHKALDENDGILISGGVSMGEFDLVPEALEKNGVRILFDQVAIQPGKPTTFGVSSNSVVFGLPGNPVSTFVVFELLAKPFFYALMGHDYIPEARQCVVGTTLSRKRTERLNFVPVRIDDAGRVFPAEYHGSANITALRDSYGLVSFPVGVAELKEGSTVNVRPL